MRVSDQQMIALLQYQMNASYEDMTQAQTVLASGKSFRTPGENPIGAAVALDLQSRLSQNKGFTTGADAAVNWLQTTDTALSGVNDVLVQARTLAVQGANDTLSSSDRSALAGQVGQLLQQAVQSANANYDGQYVLSGFQTNTAPFALTGSGVSTAVTYQGDSGTMQRELSPGQLTQINVTGNTALPAVFSALITLQTDLQSNNTSALGGLDLQTLDQAHDGLLLTQATVGARTNTVQAAQSTLESVNFTLTSHLSQTVDADMASAAVQFSSRQATYQATLSMAAKAVQSNLLEFLK